jgi:hypothetical protein
VSQVRPVRTMSMMESRGVLRSPARAPGYAAVVSVSTLLAPLFDAPLRNPTGAVLSVHRSALNVVIDGELIAIVSVRAGGLPNGILIAEPFDPRSLGIRPGMPVTIGNGRLEVGDGHLEAAARQANRWRPHIRPLAVPPDLDLRAAIAGRVAAPRANGLAGIVSAADSFATLTVAMASSSDAAIVRAGRALVGVGAGLTPAGDDVLVGLTAGLTALGDSRASAFASAWADHAIGRTTAVAESAHRHAALGAYSERIHDVLEAIVTGPLDVIPGTVAAAADWGATSGVDTLAGIVLALRPRVADAQQNAA